MISGLIMPSCKRRYSEGILCFLCRRYDTVVIYALHSLTFGWMMYEGGVISLCKKHTVLLYISIIHVFPILVMQQFKITIDLS